MKYFLGIDPGASTGGWGIIDEEGSYVNSGLFCEQQFLLPENSGYRFARACLEKVQAMPKQGVSSTFKFGTNYGWWQGVLDSSKISYELITPNRWMKKVLDSGNKAPNHRLAFARRRWPDAPLKRKKDSGIADGLCMAEYARQTYFGE